MPRGEVCKIHFVCHRLRNVSHEDSLHFKSGWWNINRTHVRKGVIFALHEHKHESSYLQGILTGRFENNKTSSTIVVEVEKTEKPFVWPIGKDSGFRSYKYTSVEEAAPETDAIRDIEPGADIPDRASSVAIRYARDKKVRHQVRVRSQGKCELCNSTTFQDLRGRPFIECHHIIALSDDGADRVSNVIALCPNHHREAHYGKFGESLENEMISIVRSFYEKK